MKTLQWLLAGLAIGVIAAAFRDFDRGEWISPPIPRRTLEPDGTEPVLGYDGMDQEALLDWLPRAGLDEETLENMLAYEQANLERERVLELLEEMLD